jgi:hypothetical protein
MKGVVSLVRKYSRLAEAYGYTEIQSPIVYIPPAKLAMLGIAKYL